MKCTEGHAYQTTPRAAQELDRLRNMPPQDDIDSSLHTAWRARPQDAGARDKTFCRSTKTVTGGKSPNGRNNVELGDLVATHHRVAPISESRSVLEGAGLHLYATGSPFSVGETTRGLEARPC